MTYESRCLTKVRPNAKVMKAIKCFYEENGDDYEKVETEWLYPSEDGRKVEK